MRIFTLHMWISMDMIVSMAIIFIYYSNEIRTGIIPFSYALFFVWFMRNLFTLCIIWMCFHDDFVICLWFWNPLKSIHFSYIILCGSYITIYNWSINQMCIGQKYMKMSIWIYCMNYTIFICEDHFINVLIIIRQWNSKWNRSNHW